MRPISKEHGVPEIIAKETGRHPVFIYEGRHTVTERALTQNALLMTATNEDALEAAVREHARLAIPHRIFGFAKSP